jgi:hypothetical protein
MEKFYKKFVSWFGRRNGGASIPSAITANPSTSIANPFNRADHVKENNKLQRLQRKITVRLYAPCSQKRREFL